MKKFILFVLTVFFAYSTAYLTKPKNNTVDFWDFLPQQNNTPTKKSKPTKGKSIFANFFGESSKEQKITFNSPTDSLNYLKSKKLYHLHKYTKAYTTFLSLWQKGTKFDSLALYIAKIAYEIDSLKESQNWIDSAKILNPKNYELLSFQAKLYNLDKQRRKAYNTANKALSSSNSDYIPALIEKAYAAYYLNSTVKEALYLTNKILSLDSTNSDAFYIQSLISSYKNKPQEAFATLFKIIKKDSNFTKAYAQIAYMYIDSAYQKSIIYHKIALKKPHPQKYIYYLNIGLAYSRLNKIDSCLYFYNKCIQKKPDYFLVYNNRGYLYYLLKKYKKAIKDYNKSIKLKPNYLSAHIYRGVIYYNQGNFVQALNDFYSAHEIDPTNQDAIYNIGITHDALGNKQDAIEMYQKYLSLATDNQTLNYVRKRILELKNQK